MFHYTIDKFAMAVNFLETDEKTLNKELIKYVKFGKKHAVSKRDILFFTNLSKKIKKNNVKTLDQEDLNALVDDFICEIMVE